MTQLQTRATYDLGCPAPQIAVYHLDARTKAAVGCGRRLLYVESCQRIRGKHACAWVLDTPTFVQAQWPQWYAAPRPATYVVVQPAPGPERIMATTLFEGPAPAPTPSATGQATPAGTAGSLPAAASPAKPPPSSRGDSSGLFPDPFGSAAPGGTAAPPGPTAQPGPSSAPPGSAPPLPPSADGRDRTAPPDDRERGRIISTELGASGSDSALPLE
jgi:hypothetical protein